MQHIFSNCSILLNTTGFKQYFFLFRIFLLLKLFYVSFLVRLIQFNLLMKTKCGAAQHMKPQHNKVELLWFCFSNLCIQTWKYPVITFLKKCARCSSKRKKSCKPTFIHADFILRFPEAKLSLFQTLVIRIKWQGLVRVKKYSLSQTSWKILAHE